MYFDHMPWLADYGKKLPVASNVIRARTAARARTTARFERGAHSKDLFYYLVYPQVYPAINAHVLISNVTEQ